LAPNLTNRTLVATGARRLTSERASGLRIGELGGIELAR
jgi:hypothetical protein